MRPAFIAASLSILLAGCSAGMPPAQSPLPSPYPPEYLPTVIAMTAEAAGGLVTRTAATSVEESLPTDTPEPTLTPTPQATSTATTIPSHELATIEIQSPGPMSKVVSPITLRMNIVSGENEKVQMDLYGEDGRLLARILKKVPRSGKGVDQVIRIPFEIPTAAEVARLSISTSDKAGRIQALKSVRLLLLSTGDNEINPTGDPSEPFAVFSPGIKEEASGGVLRVRGDIWPFNLNPVLAELIGPDGRSLGMRVLSIGQLHPQLFETTIPYTVDEPTLARLTLRQQDDRMEGWFYVYSQEILLNP